MTAYAGEALPLIPGSVEQNVGSVSLNGTTSYLQRAHASQVGLDPDNEFSILVSSRPNPVPGSGVWYTLASKWGSSAADQDYWFALIEASGSHYLVLKWQDSAVRTATSPAAVTPGTSYWSRYGVVFEDPGSGATWNVYFYEDGELVGASPVAAGDRTTPLNQGTANFRLGATNITAGGENFYDGNLDDVHFWKDVALSAASIGVWNATMASGYEGMSAYWPFEPGASGDWSPNENDLSWVNVNPATHSPYASFSDKRITSASWAAWVTWPSFQYRYHAHPAAQVPIGAPQDEAPPYITNVNPSPGLIGGSRAQAAVTPIEFDVKDDAPGLRIVLVTLKYTGGDITYVVHDGSAFLEPFNSSESVRTVISNGYHFKLLPKYGGWRGSFQLWVYALDRHGNLEGSLP